MLDLAVDTEINLVAFAFMVSSEAELPVRNQGKRCSC